MLSPTSPSLRERLDGVDLCSRHAQHRAVIAAEAAFASGDLPFAECLCHRVLLRDTGNEQAFSLLQHLQLRDGRTTAALTTANAVIEYYRSLQRSNSTEHGLLLLQSRGFEPRGLLDIGAYHGEFSLFARQFFPAASVLMVEPQAQKHEFLLSIAELLGGDCHVRSELLGDRDREACDFHQMCTPVGSTGSSIYEELSGHRRETIRMPMRTVDGLLAAFPDRHFDFVKLDVQGAELDVLRGARRTLPGVEVMFVELSLHAVNRGAPQFAEVVATLDGLGFACFDLIMLPRSGEGLQQQCDAIFVRKDSVLWPHAAADSDLIPRPEPRTRAPIATP